MQALYPNVAEEFKAIVGKRIVTVSFAEEYIETITSNVLHMICKLLSYK